MFILQPTNAPGAECKKLAGGVSDALDFKVNLKVMKLGRYLWLAFLGIFVTFIIFGIVTSDDIRDSFHQIGSFRELPRKTQILIGIGVWPS